MGILIAAGAATATAMGADGLEGRGVASGAASGFFVSELKNFSSTAIPCE
jgi:hypothetical protein